MCVAATSSRKAFSAFRFSRSSVGKLRFDLVDGALGVGELSNQLLESSFSFVLSNGHAGDGFGRVLGGEVRWRSCARHRSNASPGELSLEVCLRERSSGIGRRISFGGLLGPADSGDVSNLTAVVACFILLPAVGFEMRLGAATCAEDLWRRRSFPTGVAFASTSLSARHSRRCKRDRPLWHHRVAVIALGVVPNVGLATWARWTLAARRHARAVVIL